jgi:hypothetical protein
MSGPTAQASVSWLALGSLPLWKQREVQAVLRQTLNCLAR